MTDLEQAINKIKHFDKQATPGPWTANGAGQLYFGKGDPSANLYIHIRPEDAALIAIQRTWLMRIIEDWERLKAENQKNQCPWEVASVNIAPNSVEDLK